MHTELKKNVSWVRRQRPIICADGIYGHTITMNPWPIIEGDTLFLFYVGDDANGQRKIRLATAPVDQPETFTYRGTVLENGPAGSFDHAWTVMPQVVRLHSGRYFMVYSGNCGHGQGLSQFPGLGVAWSDDLYHWEKYQKNPVIPPATEPTGETLVGIAGGGLLTELLEDGTELLHLYYTGCLTLGDNVFLDQQKALFHATSTDGIHWNRHGRVRMRTTALDYENIASAGGPVLRDSDGLYRIWNSSIGTRWGVYSITYAESEDGIHWNRGVRYGESLAMGPESRDVDELFFRENRWQDQSVSYPGIIRLGNQLRMYYCGNEYGVGGIGTAVSTPLRLALTGESGGKAKIWDHSSSTMHYVALSSQVRTNETGLLTDGIYQEGITYNASVFYEQFPVSAVGESPLSVRAIATNHLDGVHIQIFLCNQSENTLTNVTVELDGFESKLSVQFSDINFEQNKVLFGKIDPWTTVCCHGIIQCCNIDGINENT